MSMSSSSLSRYWLCYFLIPLNLYGDYINKAIGVPTFVFNTITALIYVFHIASSGKVKIKRTMRGFIFISFIVAFFHILFFQQPIGEIKHLIYVALFVLVACNENEETYNLMKKVILIVTIPMSLDVFVHIGTIRAASLNLYNIRLLTMLDKPYYTLIFAVAMVILFHLILASKRKIHKVLYCGWLIVLFYVLFSLVQSKTGVLAAIIGVLIEFYVRYRDKKLQILLLASAICILFFFGSIVSSVKIVLPDIVKNSLDFVSGNYSAGDKTYITYLVRMEILKIVGLVLTTHPLFGVGYGGFYSFASASGMQNYTLGLADMESALLSVPAEGGLVYLVAFAWLIGKIFKRIRINKSQLVKGDTIGIVTCMLILLVGNDFMSTFFWCLLGAIWTVVDGKSASTNNLRDGI